MKQIISSSSPEMTEKIAVSIGKNLRGQEIIELVSDLGGGKTTFVRGLAKGAGSDDHVSSPSFTISKTYQASELTIHHYDFYRLNDAGILVHELTDIAHGNGNVVVIEWADVVKGVLSDNLLTVTIRRTGDETRELVFSGPDELSYLLEDL